MWRRLGQARRFSSTPTLPAEKSTVSSAAAISVPVGSTLGQRVKSFVLGGMVGVAFNAGMLYDDVVLTNPECKKFFDKVAAYTK